MPKQCQAENCDRNVFSHNYCQVHQYMRTDKKWLKNVLKQHKKGNTRIKHKSDKRTKEDIVYKKIKSDREYRLKRDGQWRCIFCNIPFVDSYTPDWHHLKGRDGDLMINPKYLYPAHTCCHIRDYHQATVDHMKSMFWYEAFLERIKEIDIDLWKKEKRKERKV